MADDKAFSFTGVLKSFQQALGGDSVLAKNAAEAADRIKDAIEQHTLVQYDTITGNYRMTSAEGTKIFPENQAKSIFTLVLSECVRVKMGESVDARTRRLNKNEMESVWELTKTGNPFDSRKDELYALPAWDGKPRMDNFMKDYFECDCDPGLFRLFLTSVIAKWDNPKVPVDYFFDFVSEGKGNGKSTLFAHLFGERALDYKLGARKEDLFVAAYGSGALVVLDDECNWIGKGFDQFTYDEFKSLVTTKRDTFSRKFCQPETHDRSFIIVRTSNEPRSVFSIDERRQILFNIGLPADECRHWNMSEEDRLQLLSEAREFYLQNGKRPYELTTEQKQETRRANMDNYDTDTAEYQNILKFIRLLKNDLSFRAKYEIHSAGEDEVYVAWFKYADWCKDEHIECADSRRYNRQIRAIAAQYPDLLMYYDKKRNINGTAMKVARIVQRERVVEIPD